MPGKAVIVFDFDEPDDDMTLGAIIFKAKEVFENMPGVKAHMAINDAADRVIAIFGPLHEGEDDGEGANT